jgi:hypothetical protein
MIILMHIYTYISIHVFIYTEIIHTTIHMYRVFHKNKSTGTSIVKGDGLSYKDVMTLIKAKIHGLTKRVDGFYLKSV